MSETVTPDVMKKTLETMGAKAKTASRALATLASEAKNRCLEQMAREIESARPEILAANATDLEAARTKGIAPAMIDRLTLTDARIQGMADGLRTVAAQHDQAVELQLRVGLFHLLDLVQAGLGVDDLDIFKGLPGGAEDGAAHILDAGEVRPGHLAVAPVNQSFIAAFKAVKLDILFAESGAERFSDAAHRGV